MHSRFKHALCLWDPTRDNPKSEAPAIRTVWISSLHPQLF